MATGGQGEGMGTPQGEGAGVSKLTCAVCLEVYRRPKMLPCFHTFCQRCLQALAGTAPSFPCPACRAIVLLPPGGIPALQTNFYIEEDQGVDSSPPARLCDVCTEDREAAHCCVQCRQRYCSPCCKVHNSIASSRAHTVVPLQPDSPDGGGTTKGADGQQGRQEELCSKHRSLPVVLHCVPCRANICLQCKLTAHEGHSTEDVQDTGSRVKARLRERLQALGQQVSTVQGVLSAVRDRRDALTAVHTSTERGIRERAKKVKQLVDECQENTVGSLHAANHNLLDLLSATEEGLQHRHAALTAQAEHITRVLSGDKDTDIVNLEASLDDLALGQEQVDPVLSSLQTGSEPYLCENNPLAISAVHLQQFVGVLKKSDEKSTVPKGDPTTPGPSVTLVPGQTQSVSGPEQQSTNIVEVVYSRNPRSTVAAICTTSEKRVWVRYKPSGEGAILGLFGPQGMLKSIDDISAYAMVTVHNDTTVLCVAGYIWNEFQWINTDGVKGTCPTNCGGIGAVAKTCKQFMYAGDRCNGCYIFDVKSLDSKWDKTTLLKPFQSYRLLRAVSSCGKYVVFCGGNTAQLFSKSYQTLQMMSTYSPPSQNTVLDACFFPVGGREVLVVLVEGDRQLHVVDHTDGCRFLHYLDTGHFTLDDPQLLATDQHSVLWVACSGGKMLMIQM